MVNVLQGLFKPGSVQHGPNVSVLDVIDLKKPFSLYQYTMYTIARLSTRLPSSRGIVCMSSNEKSGRDAAKLKTAVNRVKAASKQKRDKLVKELQTAVDNIDRIAREEVEFIKTLFDDDSDTDDVTYDEIDDIVIFRDDK